MNPEEEEDIGIDNTVIFAVEAPINRKIIRNIGNCEFIFVTVGEFYNSRSGDFGLEVIMCGGEVGEVSEIERTSRDIISSRRW